MTLCADVTFTTEGIVVISGLLSILTGAIVFMFRQLSTAHSDRLAATVALYESQLKAEREEKKSYKEMATESIAAMEVLANEKRAVQGKRPFKPIAPVVPEHNSPVTEEQQNTADLQTNRARLTAAKLLLGLPARESGPPETEEERAARLAAEVAPEGAPVSEPVPALTPEEVEALKKALADAPEKIAEKVVEKIAEKEGEKAKQEPP